MEIEQKIELLKSRGAKDLVEKLKQAEDALEVALVQEADFKAANQGYLGSGGDCKEVKRILAELAVQAPDIMPAAEGSPAGKKMTVADKATWLIQQRVDNKELSEAIDKQCQVAFLLSDHDIKVTMAKRRLEGIHTVLSLMTQQLAFLAGR